MNGQFAFRQGFIAGNGRTLTQSSGAVNSTTENILALAVLQKAKGAWDTIVERMEN